MSLSNIVSGVVLMNIAVAGTGYITLSIAVLLAQHSHITAVDIIQYEVDLIVAQAVSS